MSETNPISEQNTNREKSPLEIVRENLERTYGPNSTDFQRATELAEKLFAANERATAVAKLATTGAEKAAESNNWAEAAAAVSVVEHFQKQAGFARSAIRDIGGAGDLNAADARRGIDRLRRDPLF